MSINGVSYDVWSLSARRAWIEMGVLCLSCVLLLSLSARRAWIEMISELRPSIASLASLSARRAWIEIKIFEKASKPSKGRSPQGERG